MPNTGSLELQCFLHCNNLPLNVEIGICDLSVLLALLVVTMALLVFCPFPHIASIYLNEERIIPEVVAFLGRCIRRLFRLGRKSYMGERKLSFI